MGAKLNEQGRGVIDVAIIGAGFGGLGLAIRLQQQGGCNYRIFERASEVGGVWRDNIYPGAACDVPSHLYSFSFAPNPRWGRLYSPQQEIHRYLRHCADKYDLRRHISFGWTLEAADYDEAQGLWSLSFDGGRQQQARMVVMAIGALNIPKYPDIPGLDEFRGKVMHTAEWDAAYSLRGKRVAVVGTGASAIQVIPAVQPEVESLTVFQRTPPWVLPKRDRPLQSREQRRFARWPWLQRLARSLQYLRMESVLPVFIWDSLFTRFGERLGRRYLRSMIRDTTLRRQLTPDYSMGCKRVLLSDDYYPALCRDNVEVIADGVAALEANAIVSRSGERREVDAVILATGFKVPAAGAPLPIKGLGGRQLAQDWADAAEAYKGVAISGYPNLLYIMGPNTGPGNTSVIFYIESQIRYISQYWQALQRTPSGSFDLRPEVHRAYNDKIQRMFKGTTWVSGCNSWYLTKDGRNTTLWPGFSWRYRMITRRFSLADYELLRASGAAAQSSPECGSTVIS
ncbi:MAG: flavin-containing monooxygenase [Spongiibacter sp.]